MPSEGPFATFRAPPRIIEKIRRDRCPAAFSEMAGVCEMAFRVPANITGDSVSLAIETLRSDPIISSRNRTSVAIRHSLQKPTL
jgi:hypothetical protein